MNRYVFKQPTLRFGVIAVAAIVGYLLGFGVFVSGALVMGGSEIKSQPILVFLFNMVARPFAYLVFLGPWGIGLGWALLLTVASICKKGIAFAVFLILTAYAIVTTGNQWPAIYSLSGLAEFGNCCGASTEALYFFVLPAAILICMFFALVLVNKRD